MDCEQLREKLDNTLGELKYLLIEEELVEVSEALQCTAGGYGDVYKATLRGPARVANRVVAVKELRTIGDGTTRIRLAIHLARELRVWAKLKHPNVLELIGYHLNSQMTTARFISPFMTNGNIDEYLANAPGRVTDALRLKLLKGSLSGLVYLHSLDPRVCHGDIKPENVLVTDSIEAVLCDFGLARLADGQPSGLTTSKTIRGSTRYMSPELLEEEAIHTLSSDVWAYGCLLFKVMTGCLPYASARSDQQILVALTFKQTPAQLADLDLHDDRLTALLTKCWDINPSTRPSAAECLRYLPKTETKVLPVSMSIYESISALTHYANYRKKITSTAATIYESSVRGHADTDRRTFSLSSLRRVGGSSLSSISRDVPSTPVLIKAPVIRTIPLPGPPGTRDNSIILTQSTRLEAASSTDFERSKQTLNRIGHRRAAPVSEAEEQAGSAEGPLSATSRVTRSSQARAHQGPTPTRRPAIRIAKSNDTSVTTLSPPSRSAATQNDKDALATAEASDSEPGSSPNLASVNTPNTKLAELYDIIFNGKSEPVSYNPQQSP